MATQEKNKQVENKEKRKVSYPLTKINFILMGICLLLIVIGFWLMTGSANVGDKFNNDLLMAFAIIYRKKDNNDEDNA